MLIHFTASHGQGALSLLLATKLLPGVPTALHQVILLSLVTISIQGL